MAAAFTHEPAIVVGGGAFRQQPRTPASRPTVPSSARSTDCPSFATAGLYSLGIRPRRRSQMITYPCPQPARRRLAGYSRHVPRRHRPQAHASSNWPVLVVRQRSTIAWVLRMPAGPIASPSHPPGHLNNGHQVRRGVPLSAASDSVNATRPGNQHMRAVRTVQRPRPHGIQPREEQEAPSDGNAPTPSPVIQSARIASRCTPQPAETRDFTNHRPLRHLRVHRTGPQIQVAQTRQPAVSNHRCLLKPPVRSLKVDAAGHAQPTRAASGPRRTVPTP